MLLGKSYSKTVPPATLSEFESGTVLSLSGTVLSLFGGTRGRGWRRSRGATGGEPLPPLASAASRRVGPCTRSAVQRSCTGGARSSERERYARQASRLGVERPSTSLRPPYCIIGCWIHPRWAWGLDASFDADHIADGLDDAERAQPFLHSPDGALRGIVCHQDGVGDLAPALLHNGRDADLLLSKRRGHPRKHARPVDDLLAEEVGHHHVINRPDAGARRIPDERSSAHPRGQISGHGQDVADHGRRSGGSAGAAPAEDAPPDIRAFDQHRVELIGDQRERV